MRRIASLIVAGLMTTTGVVTLGAPATADQSPPEVTVLDRGSGPRTELRYALTPGDEQLVALRVLTRISQVVGDDPPRSGSSPAITFGLRSTVTDVAADGVITATYVYESVDVGDGSATDASAEQIREQIEPIIGLVGTLTMTAQGQVLSSDVAVPPDAPSTITTLVEQLSEQASALAVPFPAEAIGTGGRWKATSTATLNGITLSQASTYEVEKIKGSRVELTSRIVQHAKRQTYTDPSSGQEVTLLSSKATGDGKSAVVLEHLMASDAEAHVQVRQRLRTGGTTLSQTITTHVFTKPA